MITVLLAGLGALVAIMIVVAVLESAHAGAWRRIAAERRASWEARQTVGGEPWTDTSQDD